MLKLNLRVRLHLRAAQVREHQLLQPAERRVAVRQERVQVRREPAQRRVLPVPQELLQGQCLLSVRLSLVQVWLVLSVLLS